MAKTQNPLIGSSEGPLGEIYMYRKDGANIIKTRSSSNYGDPTPAQQAVRDDMKTMGALFRQLKLAPEYSPEWSKNLSRIGYQPRWQGDAELMAAFTRIMREGLQGNRISLLLDHFPPYLFQNVPIEEPRSVNLDEVAEPGAGYMQIDLLPTRANGDPGPNDIGTAVLYRIQPDSFVFCDFLEENRSSGGTANEYYNNQTSPVGICWPIILGEDGYFAQSKGFFFDVT